MILPTLRAIGEETRLRIFYLLSLGELTVADLVEILAQSQPRVSRHLKILSQAQVIKRHSEGAQVFCRLNYAEPYLSLFHAILNHIDPREQPFSTDKESLGSLQEKRADKAASYFGSVAADWDYLRTLLVPETDIEKTILLQTKDRFFDRHIDLGTGTGRMLKLMHEQVHQGLGLDNSKDMLSVARVNLADMPTERFTVRQADLYDLQSDHGTADLVTIHMVLHYLENPRTVFHLATRLLRPGGLLVIVDLLPHNLEDLRLEKAHRRLGFAKTELDSWAESSGLACGDFITLKGDKLDAFVAVYKLMEKTDV